MPKPGWTLSSLLPLSAARLGRMRHHSAAQPQLRLHTRRQLPWTPEQESFPWNTGSQKSRDSHDGQDTAGTTGTAGAAEGRAGRGRGGGRGRMSGARPAGGGRPPSSLRGRRERSRCPLLCSLLLFLPPPTTLRCRRRSGRGRPG